jgi:predicted enzyme related to lactoylglutathione lyase
MTISPNPVNWFEIATTDLARAQKFYEAAFGLDTMQRTTVDGYELAFFPMEMNVQGAAGALINGPQYTPSHEGTLIYFKVASIDAALKKIEAAGGKTFVPRKSIGQYGFIAIWGDSEGNRLGLHEMPKQ